VPAPRPSLATRAAEVKIRNNLAKAGRDKRSREQFTADLAAETERSLRRHPERQPWGDSRYRKAERAVPGADGAA